MNRRLKWRYAHKFVALAFYYGIFRHLPGSTFPILGKPSKWLRGICGRVIFKKCAKSVNIEHGAMFGCGFDIEIGERSGLGVHCCIPSDTIIGDDVMMGPNCYILARNHAFDRVDIPMIDQKVYPNRQAVIESDVWIGRDVIFTPGRTIRQGSIIAAGCVLCKDFPPYSIVGGNPARLIRSRRGGGNSL